MHTSQMALRDVNSYNELLAKQKRYCLRIHAHADFENVLRLFCVH